MAKDSCPRSPDIDDITASVWPVLVSLIAALHRVVWGRRQAVRPSPQHVGSASTPLGLNITGKQYVAPQLLAYILAMLHELAIFFLIPMPRSTFRLPARPPSLDESEPESRIFRTTRRRSSNMRNTLSTSHSTKKRSQNTIMSSTEQDFALRKQQI